MKRVKRKEEFVFGYVYPADQIQRSEWEVNQMKAKLAPMERVFNAINSQITDFVKDYPKLNVNDRRNYKIYKSRISVLKRDLVPKEQKLKYMRLSQELPPRDINIFDIIKLSEKENITPSEAVNKYMQSYPEYFYHPYIWELARQLNNYQKTFKYADEIEFDKADWKRKVYWLDKANAQEDKLFGKGKTPLATGTKYMKQAFEVLKKNIIKDEKDFIQDAVKDHIGRPTVRYTPAAIKAITTKQEIQPGVFAGEFYDPEANLIRKIALSVPRKELVMQYDVANNEMGGFFSKIFGGLTKIVLSPLQIFQSSTFGRIINKTLPPFARKYIPSGLFEALGNLSQVSAQILSGKISKANLRKAVKAVSQVGEAATMSTFQNFNRALALGDRVSPIRNTKFHRSVTASVKGLGTSAKNVALIPSDVGKGQKIDVKARAGDVLVVGATALAVVTGGAGAVLIPIAMQAGAAQTGADKSTAGKLIVKGATVYASGGGNLAQVGTDIAKQQAVELTAVQLEKKGFVKASLAKTLMHAGSGAVDVQDFTSIAVKDIAKQEALKQVGKKTGSNVLQVIGTSAINSGFDTSNIPLEESFGVGVHTGMKSIALQKADDAIGEYVPVYKYAHYLDKLPDINKLNFKNSLKTFTPKDMDAMGEVAQNELNIKMGNVSLEFTDIMTGIGEGFKNAFNGLTSLDLNVDIDQLFKNTEIDIAKQYELYRKKLLNIRLDYFKSLDLMRPNLKFPNADAHIRKLKAKFDLEMNLKLDKFRFDWYDKTFGLTKKYGPDLLKYLMHKYGPKPDYSKYIKQTDRLHSQSYQYPNKRIFKDNPAQPFNLKWIGYGILGLVTYKVATNVME